MSAVEWPVLDSLDEAERREFLALGRRRSFSRDEVVCHAGDPADALHFVQEGRLAVRLTLESGDTAMVNVLAPGDYFGEIALLREDRARTATIVALEPAVTVSVSGAAFRGLAARRPAVQEAIAVLLAGRVDVLSQRLVETMYVGVDRRLYRRLVELAGVYGDDERAVIPLTQSQLADLTGGTRPTVNQALQRLVDQSIVRVERGRVEILDLARLRAKCGG